MHRFGGRTQLVIAMILALLSPIPWLMWLLVPIAPDNRPDKSSVAWVPFLVSTALALCAGVIARRRSSRKAWMDSSIFDQFFMVYTVGIVLCGALYWGLLTVVSLIK
jgi:nitrate reductase gamma subunit